LLVLVAAHNLDLNAPAVDESIIDAINSDPHSTWTAGVNARFVNKTVAFAKRLCGVLPNSPIKLPVKKHLVKDPHAIPTSFDARTQWGQTCASLSEIRDQGDCGSCWAFGAVESMTDRTCIKSNGQLTPELSAEDVLSCCDGCGMGCAGGYPGAAWQWWISPGVVTGGLYDSHLGCYPYQVAACDHHVKGTLPPCGKNEVPTPSCVQKCESGYNLTYSADKHMGSTAYSVSSNVADIQTEIMTNGPVEASYTVFMDFVHYKSGVYVHKTGAALGGHAVKILGWGVLNNVPYWTVANSWNTQWGNQGYFLIKRGVDECGIESGIVAGEP